MRRAGQRTRCVGAGAGPESARRPAGTAAAHLSVHCPRSRRGPAHRRRRRRDVPRQDRGARARRGDLRAAAAPLHARLALGGPGTESPRDQAPHRARRRRPVARASAAGVPVPSALPASAQERALPRRAGDDSPIRVVITFQDGRTLVYAWGNRESRNESFASWAGRNRMVVVLQRAEDADGSWHVERRDPFGDYRRLWNNAPKPIVSVGVSSDSDGLKIRAAAEIGDLTWHAP